MDSKSKVSAVVSGVALAAAGVAVGYWLGNRHGTRKRHHGRRVPVGVGIVVWKDETKSEFLVGERANTHGAGTLALPGGWLVHGESVVAAATRELAEEVGLVPGEAASNVTPLSAMAVKPGENMLGDSADGVGPAFHSVSVFAETIAGAGAQPQLMEPEKCTGWKWMDVEAVAHARTRGHQVFPSLAQLLAQMQ